jgi:hypothetical protein
MSVCRRRLLAILALGLVFATAATHAQTALPAQARPAKPADIIQRGPASSADAPHIDSVTLREKRSPGKLFIVQEIAFHSSKGNATNLHFALVSVSTTAPRLTVRDHPIKSPSARQQRGTFIAATFRCGRFQKNYSHVTRATIIDADG